MGSQVSAPSAAVVDLGAAQPLKGIQGPLASHSAYLLPSGCQDFFNIPEKRCCDISWPFCILDPRGHPRPSSSVWVLDWCVALVTSQEALNTILMITPLTELTAPPEHCLQRAWLTLGPEPPTTLAHTCPSLREDRKVHARTRAP